MDDTYQPNFEGAEWQDENLVFEAVIDGRIVTQVLGPRITAEHRNLPPSQALKLCFMGPRGYANIREVLVADAKDGGGATIG